MCAKKIRLWSNRKERQTYFSDSNEKKDDLLVSSAEHLEGSSSHLTWCYFAARAWASGLSIPHSHPHLLRGRKSGLVPSYLLGSYPNSGGMVSIKSAWMLRLSSWWYWPGSTPLFQPHQPPSLNIYAPSPSGDLPWWILPHLSLVVPWSHSVP